MHAVGKYNFSCVTSLLFYSQWRTIELNTIRCLKFLWWMIKRKYRIALCLNIVWYNFYLQKLKIKCTKLFSTIFNKCNVLYLLSESMSVIFYEKLCKTKWYEYYSKIFPLEMNEGVNYPFIISTSINVNVDCKI